MCCCFCFFCLDPPSVATSDAVGGANGEEEEAEPKEKEKKMSRKELKKLKKQVTKYNLLLQHKSDI